MFRKLTPGVLFRFNAESTTVAGRYFGFTDISKYLEKCMERPSDIYFEFSAIGNYIEISEIEF